MNVIRSRSRRTPHNGEARYITLLTHVSNLSFLPPYLPTTNPQPPCHNHLTPTSTQTRNIMGWHCCVCSTSNVGDGARAANPLSTTPCYHCNHRCCWDCGLGDEEPQPLPERVAKAPVTVPRSVESAQATAPRRMKRVPTPMPGRRKKKEKGCCVVL
jgi:hypothetical protein